MMEPSPSFTGALGGERLAVIAELKRRSPSKGALDDSLNAAVRTRAYADGGASALSILTEPARFGGSLSDLREARAAVTIPLLRKDFVTDAVQILEARAYGASAVLLIARALAPARLRELAAAAVALGLTPLVEVRDEDELADAVDIAAAAVGVNNRNLETLVIEPEVGARLIPLVPADRIAVYESGVSSAADAERAAALGADAVLVGSALSLAADPAALIGALRASGRRRRD
jgi:indole-3-glycerol phosphate synthase